MDALNEARFADHVAFDSSRRPRRRYWTLWLLFLMATFSMVDKMVITVLVDPIKREFGRSDTELGMLSMSFALFFAVAGIPLGIVADRVNRRNLIAICMTIWSLATVACGMVTAFLPLLGLRVVVGAGESGATPSAVSMISDLFRPIERARALAIYYLFTPIGSGIGLSVGAILAQDLGWRKTMIAAGLPGLVIVLALLATAREPARLHIGGKADVGGAPPFGETLRFLAGQTSLLHLGAAITLVTIAVNGFGMWMFPFFTRVDHLSPASAGWQISLATYPVSSLGMIAVGWLSDRLGRRDERWRVWIPAILSFACLPAAVAATEAADPIVALAFTGLWMTTGISWFGASYAACQSLVLPRMRATVSAMMLLLTTLLGFGFGPLITGRVSDWMAPIAGARSVAYGMVGVNLLAVWGGVHFLLAAGRLRRDLVRVASLA
jgi:MFS family permease